MKASSPLAPIPCTDLQWCWDGEDEASRRPPSACLAQFVRHCDNSLVRSTRHLTHSIDAFGTDEGLGDVCIDDGSYARGEPGEQRPRGCGGLQYATDAIGVEAGVSHFCSWTNLFGPSVFGGCRPGESLGDVGALCDEDA